MISNAGLGTTASEQNTTVDTEGKEVMTSSEVEAYVLANGYGEFENFSEEIQNEMKEIVLNVFKKLITKEISLDESWNQMSRDINTKNFAKNNFTYYLKHAKQSLNFAQKKFAEDGHHSGNIVIID
jgi:Na+-translocating ferredoxin:NAD+ oxidoreductase RnfG subunit